MTDIVNEYFRRFYPLDRNEAWEMKQCGGGYGREYVGDRAAASVIFPEMVCVDGFKMSVQGHFGAYSQPRDDFADQYSQVEVSIAPGSEPLFEEEARGDYACDEFKIFAYVPVELIERVVAKHGGLRDMDHAK